MDAVEVTVYIVVAIVVGTLIIAFLFGIDFTSIYNTIVSAMTGDNSAGFEKVDNETFVREMLLFQTACEGAGQGANLTVFLEDTRINKSNFFGVIKSLSLCRSFQSATYDCGAQESFIEFDDIIAPSVVRVRCRGPSIFYVNAVT